MLKSEGIQDNTHLGCSRVKNGRDMAVGYMSHKYCCATLV
eukprot:COSAG05_NODE_1665_length_4312_cov_2.267268_2_plen_40_part_00